ncbi:MAG: sarcosine oxidase subunit delta [Ilumatobacteraceae bacterium]
MLIVPCPNCGPRNASDLRYVGESRSRPDPNDADPAEWRTYLYIESNPAGVLRETWYCRSGCRRYFVLERDTVTNEFHPPPLPGDKGGRA